MVAEREKAAANQIVAPRMYIYPFWRGTDPRLTSPDGAKQSVDEWHALGVDGVKIVGKPKSCCRTCGRWWRRRRRRRQRNSLPPNGPTLRSLCSTFCWFFRLGVLCRRLVFFPLP
jgi:hypothetical protein